MKGRPSSWIGRQIVGGMQHWMAGAISVLAVWFSLAICSTVCLASDPSDGQLYNIDIPSLNAAQALNRLAEQTGAIMLFPYDIAETRQANAVLGRFTLMDALSELLKDSGLSSGLSDKRVIQIALDKPVDHEIEEKAMATEKVPLRTKVGVFLASLLVVSGADAQDSETEDAEDAVEEVVVTGSRLQRNSFNVSTPLISVSNDVITDAGLSGLGEILIDEVPSLYESTSNTNSQSQIGNTGVTSMNLRRLGSNRTLVLIDGRRTVANAYGGKFVSLNTIPATMVERVEIVTGGSSGTYGSDAIAGVVNIITQQDQVGFGLETRVGYTPEAGGEEFTINADYGTKFGDGRGYLFIGATYNDQQGISNADRERAALEADFDYNTTLLCNEMQTETGDQCIRDIASPADWRDRSDGTAGGVFSEGPGEWWYNEDGLQTGWSEERDGLFSRQWDVVKIPNEQVAVALKLEYDLSETTNAYFQVQYSKNDSFNFKSPEDDSEASDVATIDRITGAPGEIRSMVAT